MPRLRPHIKADLQIISFLYFFAKFSTMMDSIARKIIRDYVDEHRDECLNSPGQYGRHLGECAEILLSKGFGKTDLGRYASQFRREVYERRSRV